MNVLNDHWKKKIKNEISKIEVPKSENFQKSQKSQKKVSRHSVSESDQLLKMFENFLSVQISDTLFL